MRCHTPINKLALEDEDHTTLGLVAIKKQRSQILPLHSFGVRSSQQTRTEMAARRVYSAVVLIQGRTSIALSIPCVCKNSQCLWCLNKPSLFEATHLFDEKEVLNCFNFLI